MPAQTLNRRNTPPQPTQPSQGSIAKDYTVHGYCLVRDAIPQSSIDALLGNYLDLVFRITGRRFPDAHGEEIVAFYNEHPELEAQIYLKIRETPWLTEFASQPAITSHIRTLLMSGFGMFSKIPFRIDMPMWTQEIALWHQDHFYVRGNTDTVTAWIPFQRTTYLNGCLSIMPGSHKLGPVPHDAKVGKKSVPTSIFDREIRMVEMDRGDLLLFNSLLLHSGNLNVSPGIRYSLQPRYTPAGAPTDPAMGDILPM